MPARVTRTSAALLSVSSGLGRSRTSTFSGPAIVAAIMWCSVPVFGAARIAPAGERIPPDGHGGARGAAARMPGMSKVLSELSETGVRTIALDDPDKRNALSVELLDDLIAALEEARDDDATRCVVLASTHPNVFCAGGNLAAFG